MAVVSYQAALVDRGFNLVQKFGNGYVFARIRDFEDANTTFERFDTLAAGSGSSTIAGSAAAFFHELEDAAGNEFFLETETDRVLQAFIGVHPPRLRLFRAFPDPIIRGNLAKVRTTADLSATAIGWVDGTMTPYERPTTLAEMIIPRDLLLRFGIFNPESIAVFPRFLFIFRRLLVKWLDPKDKKDGALIQRIIDGKERAKWFSPGIEPFTYDIENKLGITPVPVEVIEGEKGVIAG